MTTWRKKIGYLLADYPGESLIYIVPNESVLDVEFDDGYGAPEGPPFTAWTQNRVVFPTEYDGSEGVSSVPRQPCDEVIHHGW